MITKGYGFTLDDIDWSSPADLEPYAKAHKMQKIEEDNLIYAWCGSYLTSAVSFVIEHCFTGSKAKSKYIDKPLLQPEEENRPLTEEEKQKAVDLFFAREDARRINWKRNHHKDGTGS